MRLIDKPYKVKVANQGGDRAHHRWVLPTDRGNLFCEKAAEILGLTDSAMRTRITRAMSGVLNIEHLFAPIRSELVSRPKAQRKYKADEACRIPDEDIGKYSHLSDRPRGRKLRKIREVGKWEARHYGQTGG